MHISVEYLKRHGVDVDNFVRHDLDGCVFLRNVVDKKVHWEIHQFHWKPGQTHPGEYIYNVYVPCNHNMPEDTVFPRDRKRFQQSSLYCDEKKAIVFGWDEYEDFILERTQEFDKNSVVKGMKEKIVVAWEMFAYSSDRYLTENFVQSNCDSFFDSINPELSIDVRYKAYLAFNKDVIERCKWRQNLFKLWKYDVNNYLKTYSDWWATLIANK